MSVAAAKDGGCTCWEKVYLLAWLSCCSRRDHENWLPLRAYIKRGKNDHRCSEHGWRYWTMSSKLNEPKSENHNMATSKRFLRSIYRHFLRNIHLTRQYDIFLPPVLTSEAIFSSRRDYPSIPGTVTRLSSNKTYPKVVAVKLPSEIHSRYPWRFCRKGFEGSRAGRAGTGGSWTRWSSKDYQGPGPFFRLFVALKSFANWIGPRAFLSPIFSPSFFLRSPSMASRWGRQGTRKVFREVVDEKRAPRSSYGKSAGTQAGV